MTSDEPETLSGLEAMLDCAFTDEDDVRLLLIPWGLWCLEVRHANDSKRFTCLRPGKLITQAKSWLAEQRTAPTEAGGAE